MYRRPRIIGWRKNGAPIWEVMGASDGDGDGSGGDSGTGDAGDGDSGGSGDGDGSDDGDGDGDGSDDGDDGAGQLGDKGKQALDRMKAKRDAARKALKPWADLGRELNLTPEQVRELAKKANKSGDGDGQPDADEIRRQARAEAQSKVNDRIVRLAVKAAAGGKLADPTDATRLLDLSKFEVDEDGEVNEDEIAEAIEDLLKNKPYLAAQGGKRFQGSGDGGPRNGGKKSQQLTRDELKRMSPQEIEKARAEGRLDDLLAGKNK